MKRAEPITYHLRKYPVVINDMRCGTLEARVMEGSDAPSVLRDQYGATWVYDLRTAAYHRVRSADATLRVEP